MTTQNTPFASDYALINCKGQLIDLQKPRVMGIINTTPNSFYKGSRFQEKDAVLTQVEQFLQEGADFIDIGGHSTKPGAEWVPEAEERNRTIPFIEAILERFPDTFISIDTFRSTIAEESVQAGAAIINDVSGGNLDDTMFETVARLQVPYILMHMQGNPQTMQQNPTYDDVTQEIIRELSSKIENLKKRHLPDVIVDPGFGFGKTLGHNYQLLRQLYVFRELGLPLLVGLSRKSMIKKTLNIPPEEGGNATTVLNTLALEQGAQILRVHDVKPAVEAVTLWQHYQSTPVDQPISTANS